MTAHTIRTNENTLRCGVSGIETPLCYYPIDVKVFRDERPRYEWPFRRRVAALSIAMERGPGEPLRLVAPGRGTGRWHRVGRGTRRAPSRPRPLSDLEMCRND